MRPDIGVGVGVIVWSADGKSVLLHKRGAGVSHMRGAWCSPGGHLEVGESFVDCAKREVLEECGSDLKITEPVVWDVMNTVYVSDYMHYVTIMMQCHHLGGEAAVMEPEKCDEWKWWTWESLGPTGLRPLMLGNSMMRDKYPTGLVADPIRIANHYANETLGRIMAEEMHESWYSTERIPEFIVERHLKWMCLAITSGQVVGEKAHRWIGYIQGELRGLEAHSIHELRDHTRKSLSA